MDEIIESHEGEKALEYIGNQLLWGRGRVVCISTKRFVDYGNEMIFINTGKSQMLKITEIVGKLLKLRLRGETIAFG